MFFVRFLVTALSFGAATLAAPIGVPGAALPVDGLIPGSSLPIDTSKLPLDTNKLPMPISGGAAPALGGGASGIKLPLTRREDATYAGALDGVQKAAGGVLAILDGSEVDIAQLASGLGGLSSALELVNSALAVPDLDLDGLLAGGSLEDLTNKTSDAFGLVKTVLSKVQSLPAISDAKDQLANIVTLIPKIEDALGLSPELKGVINGLLVGVIGLVNGILKGLGITL
ncbi:unnamed protein product [Rhizoctonia solani]|uniref:Uncharacterized protein n=1 Tax=Rhizoctonia solani TaxID=456999 RepID=A0A8H3ALZ8_9AGAM|nr:unnamed protein product [Rhizoctonia solani]